MLSLFADDTFVAAHTTSATDYLYICLTLLPKGGTAGMSAENGLFLEYVSMLIVCCLFVRHKAEIFRSDHL